MGTKKNTKIKSSLWDEIYYYYYNEYSDRTIRSETQFNGELDMDVLVQAFNKTIDLIPVLKSRWVTGWFNNYWEVIQDFDIRNNLTVTENFEVAENFMVDNIDAKAGAQIKVLIYRHDGKDSMRILYNHMISDGAGMKDFYRLLSRYYSGLKHNKEFVMTDFINGDRQFWQLFKNFSFGQRLKFAFAKDSTIKYNSKLGFPYEKDAPATDKVLLKSNYDEDFFIKFKEKNKKMGVTINDVILAAFGRAMLDICPDNKLPFDIDCSIDLRRYLREGKTTIITNMVSGIVLPFIKVEGENFDETVLRIHRLMNKLKNDYSCLNRLELLRLVSLELKIPFLRKNIAKKNLGNSMTGISNVGSTTDDMVSYSGLNVEDFYIMGAMKYPPYTLITIYSFRNLLHIFTTIVGSKKDVETGKLKLDLIKSYLKSYIE